MPRITFPPGVAYLSLLIIDADKDWQKKNITNLGAGAHDLNAKLSSIITKLSQLTIDADKNWAGKNITNLGTAAYDVATRLGEVVTARGSKASLDARLDVVLEEDGTLKDHIVEVSAKARAYLGTSQHNLVHNMTEKVQLDTESYDPGGNFDSVTTYRFTAPIPGYYLFLGNIQFWDVVADKIYGCRIYKNGSLASAGRAHSSNVSMVDASVRDIIYMATNDYMEFYGWHQAGVNTIDMYGDEDHTFMAVHFISKV